MSHFYTILKTILLIPAALISIYIIFLWATYIDNTIVSGSKYGFTIGDDKREVYEGIRKQGKSYPNLYFYIRTGERAGDSIEAHVDSVLLETIKDYESWGIQYDGKHEYFNVLKFKFNGSKLIEIHRHRKYFELP